jgi:hypothetical protein|tara:strand:- start:57 stop:338 length:282 start_codon:yes stop_codon:yes gene_type:complete
MDTFIFLILYRRDKMKKKKKLIEGKFTRNENFEFDGEYDVLVNGKVYVVFRDTLQYGYGIWYMNDSENNSSDYAGSRFVGYTKAEVLEKLKSF